MRQILLILGLAAASACARAETPAAPAPAAAKSPAMAACEGKSPGEKVSFTGRDGGKVEATCTLMAVPADGWHHRGMGGMHRPPEAAWKACEGKKAGDEASFTRRDGSEAKGTCTAMDGKLVAMPEDCGMMKADGATPGTGHGHRGGM